LWLVQLGWELRLLVEDDFQRSHVCRSQDEVFDTMDEWRDALKAKGWMVPPSIEPVDDGTT
jgi:hypothetical protein